MDSSPQPGSTSRSRASPDVTRAAQTVSRSVGVRSTGATACWTSARSSAAATIRPPAPWGVSPPPLRHGSGQPASRELAGVELQVRAPERLEVEALLRPRPACRPEAATKRRIAGQALQRGGERFGIPGSTRRPVSPSTTCSGTPPTRDATTGSPAAMASRTETGCPSDRLASTKTSAAASSCGTSWRSRVSGRRPRARPSGSPPPGAAGRPVADDHRLERPGLEAAERPDEGREVLGRLQPADRDQQRRLPRGHRSRRRADVHRVRDHDRRVVVAGACRQPASRSRSETQIVAVVSGRISLSATR